MEQLAYRTSVWLIGLIVSVAVVACSYEDPYIRKHNWQKQQAAQLRPHELEHDKSSAWRRVDKLTVRVYRDAAYAQREPQAAAHVTTLFDQANETLRDKLRVKLVLESVRELPEDLSAQAEDLDQLLASLSKLDASSDVSLVLAMVGQHPIMTYSFHELGRARWLGQHMVMRSIDDIEEMRAFAEGLDTLSIEARRALYKQRKQHKETSVLLHELGHVLGGLHVNEATDLMHPAYHHTAVSFAPENLELMRCSVAQRTSGDAAHDTKGVAEQILALLSQSQWSGWYEGEKTQHIEALRSSLALPTPVAQQPTAATPETLQATTEDLTSLSPQDRTKYAQIEDARKRQDVKKAYKLTTELAERYVDNLAVQTKACELGMAFRVEARLIVTYCARMSTLQKAPTGPSAAATPAR